MKHVPVLLNKVLEILTPGPRKFIIDGTVDGGWHAVEIIKRLSPNGVFLGIDWDKSMLAEAESRIAPVAEYLPAGKQGVKVLLVEDNYANLPVILKDKKLGKADGLLLDLGFSSDQLESSGKGFSFLKDEPLIMRYASKGISAAEVINGKGEADLADIFWKYGNERMSRRIAKKIVEARKSKKILTTFGLVEAVKSAVPKNYEKGRIHPATRVFQALRIYVNGELDNLEEILKNLPSILKPHGVIVIISFHSLEDRLVKNYFKGMEKNGFLSILTKKPIVPEKEEIIANPKSRSAKLRAASIKIPIF